MAGGQIFDAVSSLFGTSPAGRNNQQAAATQEDAGAWMLGIQKSVESGSMSPEAGVQAIQNMLSASAAGVSNEAEARMIAELGRMGSQIIANLQSRQNWDMQAKWTDQNKDRFGILSTGQGQRPMSENESMQRGRTLMRELLMNTGQGQAFGNDTGLSRLTAGPFDVQSAFKSNLPETSTYNLVRAQATAPSELGDRMEAARMEYGNANTYRTPAQTTDQNGSMITRILDDYMARRSNNNGYIS
jgi:hypothetical protein